MKKIILNPWVLSLTTLFLALSACQKESIEPEINKVPLLLSETIVTAFADSAFVYQLETQDPEGGIVTINLLDVPDWLTFSANDQTFSGTPTRDDAGINRITIELSDGLAQVEREIKVSVVIIRSFSEMLQQSLEMAFADLTPGLDGVSVAVSEPNGTITTAWAGSSHYLQNLPISENHQYRIASITKIFTTALILRLMEEGHLELDAPFSNYLSIDGLENGEEITIRQLLSHTAGVFDHLNSNDFWSDPSNHSSKVWSNEEIFQFAIDAGASFAPGTDYAYSNTGFNILGAVAESILQAPLGEIFSSWIFEPLGLENTVYDDFSLYNNRIENLAESERAYDYHLSAAGAAGAIVSTPSDVAKFGKALYGGDFVQPENVEKMLENIGATFGGSNYGLGTRIWNDLGIYHYGHTGSLMDYRNILMYVPEKSVAIAVHSNNNHENWIDVANQVLQLTVASF